MLFIPESIHPILWWIGAILSAMHICEQSRKLGGVRWYDITGALLLFPLYYILWLLIWPGSMRRSVDDLEIAKAERRIRGRRWR